MSIAHPGMVLLEQVMRPLGISRNKLARDIGVSVGRISDIVNGKRGITPDTALRLAKYLGTTAELWMRLQTDYDLSSARRDTWSQIEQRVQVFSYPQDDTELAGWSMPDNGEGRETHISFADAKPNSLEAYGRADRPDPDPEDLLITSIEAEGMGQVLQFSIPDRSDIGDSDEISECSDDESDSNLARACEVSPALGKTSDSTSLDPTQLLAEELGLQLESADDCIDIPDPTDFRFRSRSDSKGPT